MASHNTQALIPCHRAMAQESLMLQTLLSDHATFPLAAKRGEHEMLKIAITQALPNGTCCLAGFSSLDPAEHFFLLHDLLDHDLRKYAVNFPDDIRQCIFRVFRPQHPVTDSFIALPRSCEGRPCLASKQKGGCMVCFLLVFLIKSGLRLRSLAYHDSAAVSRRRFSQCHYANSNLSSIWDEGGLDFDDYLRRLCSECSDRQQNLKYQEASEWSLLLDLAEKGLFPKYVDAETCMEVESASSASCITASYTVTGVPKDDCNIIHVKRRESPWLRDTDAIPVSNPREYCGVQTTWKNEMLVVPTFLASASDVTALYNVSQHPSTSSWFHPPTAYSFPDGDIILSSEVKIHSCEREHNVFNLKCMMRDAIKSALEELLNASVTCSEWDNIVGFMLSGSSHSGGLIVRKIVCESMQHLCGWYHGTYKFASPDDVMADQFVESLMVPNDELYCHEIHEMDESHHKQHFKAHVCDALDKYLHEFNPSYRRIHLCCQLASVPLDEYHKSRPHGSHMKVCALSSASPCDTKWGPFTIFNQWITSGWNKLDTICFGVL